MLEEILIGLGYFGAFLAGILSSVTIFLPTPGFVIVFGLAGFLNPIFIGVLAGIGAAIGELVGYIIGYGAEKYVLKKRKKAKDWLSKIDFYFKKYNPMAVIFIFAATPLPFDFAGIACGAIHYPPEKFFIATLAGKLVKYLIIAIAGYYGINLILDWAGV